MDALVADPAFHQVAQAAGRRRVERRGVIGRLVAYDHAHAGAGREAAIVPQRALERAVCPPHISCS